MTAAFQNGPGPSNTSTVNDPLATESWVVSYVAGAGTGGTPGGSTTQFQYNKAGAFGGLSTFTTDGTNLTLTGANFTQTGGTFSHGVTTITEAVGSSALTLTGATQTTSNPVINATQTWNNAGTTFTGIKLNVTNTASASGSLVMDLQVGGASQFSVTKAGSASFAGAIVATANSGTTFANADIKFGASGAFLASASNLLSFGSSAGGYGGSLSYGGIQLLKTGALSFEGASAQSSGDVFLTRRGTANFQLGLADAAAPVAQTLGVQSVVAGTTDTAGANFTICGSQGTGAGAGGAIVFQTAAAGTTGSSQNAWANALTIAADKSATFTGNISTTGSLQAFTITATNGFAVGNTNVTLFQDAADVLAQRRGVNAQTARFYNTYTDASNYERATFGWSGNVLTIGTANAGTGTARGLALQVAGATALSIGAAGNVAIAAPTSGDALTLASFAGAVGLNVNAAYGAGAAISVALGTGTGFDQAVFNATGNSNGKMNSWITNSGAGSVDQRNICGTVGTQWFVTPTLAKIGTYSAHAFSLQANGLTSLTIGTTGGVTIPAPTSGTTMQVTALAGQNAASFLAGPVKLASFTVAALPAAATVGANARAFVTDGLAPTFMATVAGGGAVLTPVYSDGANWKVG